MTFTRYGSFKTVTTLKNISETVFKAGAGRKGSILDFKAVK